MRTDSGCLIIGLLSALIALSCPPAPGSAAVARTHSQPANPAGVWPLDPEPEVLRGFEPPPGPYAAGHRGVDLGGRPGQRVRAALDGTIGFAGVIGGKPVVTVLHGARRTTYEPVVASVAAGQPVRGGDVLGSLVVTDSHCFPAACLHWGLIRGADYLDPLTLLDAGRVRLLPLWGEDPATVRLPWTAPLGRWRRPLDFLV